MLPGNSAKCIYEKSPNILEALLGKQARNVPTEIMEGGFLENILWYAKVFVDMLPFFLITIYLCLSL